MHGGMICNSLRSFTQLALASTIAGMNNAAPVYADPTNHVLLDLPFAHLRSGARCNNAIRRAFSLPSDDAQRILLHLSTLNGPVLLEMEASVLAGRAERLVVLTGRELNAELASLIVASSSDGTPAGTEAGEDNERAETTSTIISELTESGLGESVHGDGNDHPTMAAAAVLPENRHIAQMADPVIWRRPNYASSAGSSSIMTPANPFMPVTRRSEWHANEVARLQLEQLEQRQWNASTTVQRAWRQHRPGVLYPRSMMLADMVMRTKLGGNGHFEEAQHLIAVFISGVVPSALARSLSEVRRMRRP